MGKSLFQGIVKVLFGTGGCVMIGIGAGSDVLALGCWALFVALAFFND
jgi:hypothetical protein